MDTAETKVKELLSIGETSDFLGVSIDTIRRWEKKGRIEAYRSPGGHRYFKRSELGNLFGKRYSRDETSQQEVVDVQEQNETFTTETLPPLSDAPPAPPEPLEGLAERLEIDSHETASEVAEVPEETTPDVTTTEIAEPPKPPKSEVTVDTQATNLPAQNEDKEEASPISNFSPPISQTVPPWRKTVPTETPKPKLGKIALIGLIIFLIIDALLALIWFLTPRIISPIP
jgi:excisionase family DNA binding protein